MFSHYSITILPFDGQGESSAPAKKVEKKAVAAPRSSNPVKVSSTNKTVTQVTASSGQFRSGNIGILDSLSPKSKKKAGTEDLIIEARDSFTEDELLRQVKLFAHKKKKEEGANNLFSTLTASKITIHDQFSVRLHVLNSTQGKQLDAIKMDLLNHLRSSLNNGGITFEHVMAEKKVEQTASFTDKKSQFDELASSNPSLEKFRKLFNLDIEY
ncbi:MAG: hypothetical protein MK078_06540 [Crocinitomicaceae bacterium]|nr:hypothetical protein [Crocinitomicaceae bacterium]